MNCGCQYYVLLSLKDNKQYIGFTKDFRNRIKLHQSGQIKATKDRLSVKLIFGNKIFIFRQSPRAKHIDEILG